MTNRSAALTLRAKILGTLLQDARNTKGESVEACAQAIGVNPEEYQAYEAGIKSPGMPELESLSFYLEIPVEHFLSNQPLVVETKPVLDMERLAQIRQRIIAAMLRQAREEAGLTIDQLSQQTGLDVEKLSQFESGHAPVPVPELEVICVTLNHSIKEFVDQQGPIGKWNSRQQALQLFMEMPADLQTFITQPVNRPYLELAQRLSKMSVDKLRSVAETLLEITY